MIQGSVVNAPLTLKAVGTPHTHAWSTSAWGFDDNYHWHICQSGEMIDTEVHSGGIANCHEKTVCEV